MYFMCSSLLLAMKIVDGKIKEEIFSSSSPFSCETGPPYVVT